jgi:hypothetical protein
VYRLRILYDVPGWAYHHRADALQKYAPPDFEVSLDRGNTGAFEDEYHDIYLQLCYSEVWRLRQHLLARGHDSLIVTGCNTGWVNEGPLEGRAHWQQMRVNADWIVFNNRAAWGLALRPERTSWISNGVDRSIFCPTVPPERRKAKVLWLGSYYHTQTDRDLKGFWSILGPLQARLESRGIACELRRVDSMATVIAMCGAQGTDVPVCTTVRPSANAAPHSSNPETNCEEALA